MKGMSSKVTKTLDIGSVIKCIDNTGAKEIEIIGVKGGKSVRRRRPAVGIGNIVSVRVTKGSEKLKGEVFSAVIVRQKKEYMRPNGLRIKFEDSAAILLDDMGKPKGNKIKGVISKEAVERLPAIGKIANMVA